MSDIRKYSPPLFDREKFRDLVHYVIAEAPNPKALGRTKLNKILFYSDMDAYLQFGAPISGEEYQKMEHGPMSVHEAEVVEELRRSEAIVVDQVSRYDALYNPRDAKWQYVSRRTPDLSRFSAREIKIVDTKIKKICSKSATEVSRRSHDIVWQTARMGEIIPYYSIFTYCLKEPGEDSMDWARQRIAERRAAGSAGRYAGT